MPEPDGKRLYHGPGDANRIRPATWVEGELVRSWWMGAKLAGKRQLQVDTFRCIDCGYVESYTC